jgi:hypothetical protein
MRDSRLVRIQAAVHALSVVGACVFGSPTRAHEYSPIKPTLASQTVILTGNDLTIDQVLQVARYGAKDSGPVMPGERCGKTSTKQTQR